MDQQLRRITYVEDEPDIGAIVQLALEEIGGYSLSLCRSGPEAVQKVALFNPELVLLDVMMPGMDGVQTFHLLKALPGMRRTPIVFVTAKAQTHEVAHYRSLGAADVIAKPFNPITLPDHVRSIWERARAGEPAQDGGEATP